MHADLISLQDPLRFEVVLMLSPSELETILGSLQTCKVSDKAELVLKELKSKLEDALAFSQNVSA